MAYRISHSSLTELIKSIGQPFGSKEGVTSNSVLLSNIDRYLTMLGSRTVIIEEEYIDTHFIDDYCGHYARCFVDYDRKCIRLHFFQNMFEEHDFNALLLQHADHNQINALLGEYLGYIVLRPIPSSVFGKVILAVRSGESSKVILKNYETHLCGLTFSFQSIAFQEQDHAISACATVALWMGFNAVDGLPPRQVLSPYRIYEIVKKNSNEGYLSNTVDKGLNVSQISRVINERGMESLAIKPSTFSYAKALIWAYVNMDIPVIMGIDLVKKSDEIGKSYSLGKHAVTVIGFEGEKSVQAFKESKIAYQKDDDIELYLESSRIESLIVHDDQTGPYSKMNFSKEYGMSLDTDWSIPTDPGPIDASIDVLIIMNKPKVRIRFASMLSQTKELNKNLYSAFVKRGRYISWDIRLVSVCRVKQEILSTDINDEDKLRLVGRSMPRYMWKVELLTRMDSSYSSPATKVTSYYFDATDMDNASIFLFGINHSDIGIIKAVFKGLAPTAYTFNRTNQQLINLYKNLPAAMPRSVFEA